MKLTTRRTYDAALIRSIMTRPDMWRTVAEDGQTVAEYHPDVTCVCWLRVEADGETVGLYSFNAHNSVTVEIHANILPEFRAVCSRESGLEALRWIYENAPEYKKIISQIPVIYENVKRFTLGFGFIVEGRNRASYLKNGALHDQWLLGVTRDEVKGVLDEQCS